MDLFFLIGGHYEKKGGEITKYYGVYPEPRRRAGASRIAVRKYTVPQSTTLNYLTGDHLDSTSLAVNASTGDVVTTRYREASRRDKPWGEVRWTSENKTLPTRYTYTGQYSYISDSATDLSASASFGLMFYNARWYDPMTGRMAQADTIVPSGVQGLDRYAYVNNSPVMYTDPSGHCPEEEEWCRNAYKSLLPTPWVNPTEPMRRNGGWKYGDGHAGEDINADNFNDGLTEVVASTYGTVVSSNACTEDPCEGNSGSTNGGYGNMVIIAYEWDSLPPEIQANLLSNGVEEGSTIFMLYAHLSDPSSLKVGDQVAPGQFIGFIGCTGDSFDAAGNHGGPHLHLEIRVENPNMDEYQYPGGPFYNSEDGYLSAYYQWHGDSWYQPMIPVNPNLFFDINN